MIVVSAAKPCSNLNSLLPRSPKKPTKRRNSTEDDTGRRTRSKSDNFRKSSLVITKVPLV